MFLVPAFPCGSHRPSRSLKIRLHLGREACRSRASSHVLLNSELHLTLSTSQAILSLPFCLDPHLFLSIYIGKSQGTPCRPQLCPVCLPGKPHTSPTGPGLGLQALLMVSKRRKYILVEEIGWANSPLLAYVYWVRHK